MQIKSISSAGATSIECDDYVPVVVRFDGDFEWPPLYWRTGDFQKSLIEIGVDPRSGTICKITATLLPPLSEQPSLVSYPTKDTRVGLPCAALGIWHEGKRYVDEEHDVKASLAGDALTVTFGALGNCMTHSVVCNSVTFLIDSLHVLRGFVVNELPERAIRKLRSRKPGDAGRLWKETR